MTTDDIETQKQITAKHRAQLASRLHVERQAAIAAATAAHAAARERRYARRGEEDRHYNEECEAEIGRSAGVAEEGRRARATALLAKIFATGPGAADGEERTLADMIESFRAQPNRRDAVAIRAAWDGFNEVAVAELSVPLADEVLGSLFVDSITAEPNRSGAINYLSGADSWPDPSIRDALYEATTNAPTPAAIEGALVAVENAMLMVAKRTANTTPDPDHVAMHALRRSNATRADLVAARNELNRKQGARRDAAFNASYVPPSSLTERLRGALERGAWSLP